MTLQEAEIKLMTLGPRFRIQLIVFTILFIGTMLMGAQRRSMDLFTTQTTLTDGLQDDRIAGLNLRMDRTDLRVAELTRQLTETQSAVDRIVGLGWGFGSALTIMQLFGLVLQWRQGK